MFSEASDESLEWCLMAVNNAITLKCAKLAGDLREKVHYLGDHFSVALTI